MYYLVEPRWNGELRGQSSGVRIVSHASGLSRLIIPSTWRHKNLRASPLADDRLVATKNPVFVDTKRLTGFRFPHQSDYDDASQKPN